MAVEEILGIAAFAITRVIQYAAALISFTRSLLYLPIFLLEVLFNSLAAIFECGLAFAYSAKLWLNYIRLSFLYLLHQIGLTKMPSFELHDFPSVPPTCPITNAAARVTRRLLSLAPSCVNDSLTAITDLLSSTVAFLKVIITAVVMIIASVFSFAKSVIGILVHWIANFVIQYILQPLLITVVKPTIAGYFKMNSDQRSLAVLRSYFLLIALLVLLAVIYRKQDVISRCLSTTLTSLRIIGRNRRPIRPNQQEVNRLAPPDLQAPPPHADGLRHRLPSDAAPQAQAAPRAPAAEPPEDDERLAGEVDRRFICVVCLDRPRTTLLKPCNHLCLCESCADTLRMPPVAQPLARNPRCPVCQQVVFGRLRVYIA